MPNVQKPQRTIVPATVQFLAAGHHNRQGTGQQPPLSHALPLLFPFSLLFPFPPSSQPFPLLPSPLLHSLHQAGNAWVFELFAQLTFDPKHCWLRGHAYNLPINLYSNSNLKFEPRFDTIFGLNLSAIISFVFAVNLIFGNRSEFVLLLPRPHWRSAPTYCVGVRYYVCVCLFVVCVWVCVCVFAAVYCRVVICRSDAASFVVLSLRSFGCTVYTRMYATPYPHSI